MNYHAPCTHPATVLVVVPQHSTPKNGVSTQQYSICPASTTPYIMSALDAASVFQSDVQDDGSAAKLESSSRVRTKLRFTQPERWSIFYLLIYNFIRQWHPCVSHPRAHRAAGTHTVIVMYALTAQTCMAKCPCLRHSQAISKLSTSALVNIRSPATRKHVFQLPVC